MKKAALKKSTRIYAKTPVKLIKSTFYNEEQTKEELANFIKKADRLSMSEKVLEFEQKFAEFQGSKHAVCVTSGSTANMALIQALINLGRINKGDVVGFSAVTWATNVMPLLQLGLDVFPIDVEIDTLNCSSKTLQDALDKKPEIKVVFLTNVLGFCSDIDVIKNICDKRGIILIEDNCESLGTVYKGTKLGSYGIAGTFSFYVGHHMSTIEGGMICTDDEEVDTMLRMVRAHGMDRNLSKEKQSLLRDTNNVEDFYSQYTFYTQGYNFRPTEITGFLGVNQLQYIKEILKKRYSNFLKFAGGVDSGYILPVRYDHIDFISNFAFPVIARDKRIFRKYIERFERYNVEIRPIVSGNMMYQMFLQNHLPLMKKIDLPNARFIHNNGFYFGNNPDMKEEDIDIILNALDMGQV